MLRFTCPFCSRALRCADEGAGQKGKCPACGDVLTIPLDMSRVTLFSEDNRSELEKAFAEGRVIAFGREAASAKGTIFDRSRKRRGKASESS